jgi:hypothetical protein
VILLDWTGLDSEVGSSELVGEHSGENMADVLLHIFDDYGISGRIGYFMADNASSNDACIDLVLQALYPNMTRKHRVRRRLRCFGHIVNLCAQAFIMGKDASKTCKDLDSAYREGDYTRIRELWKKRGAIGRLHNIVRYIRASPQRRQFFRSIQIGGDLAAFDGLEVSSPSARRKVVAASYTSGFSTDVGVCCSLSKINPRAGILISYQLDALLMSKNASNSSAINMSLHEATETS